ncbi:hypothetical protein ACFS07_34055 [Undibacterium arcticum]
MKFTANLRTGSPLGEWFFSAVLVMAVLMTGIAPIYLIKDELRQLTA